MKKYKVTLYHHNTALFDHFHFYMIYNIIFKNDVFFDENGKHFSFKSQKDRK